MGSSSYIKNHVISQLLLERFADKSGGLMRHDMKLDKDLLTKPGRDGFVIRLWTGVTKATMEKLWSDEAENDVGKVFEKIDKRLPLNDADSKLLARFCAVHFVRSKEFIKLFKKIMDQKASTVNMEDVREDFYFKYMVRLNLLRESKIPSKFFEKIVLEYYQKSKSYLEGKSIEIRYAIGGEQLILPDGGLLVSDVVTGKYMASGGVPLLQAGQAVMVLGSGLLMGFNDHIEGVKYMPMNDENVTNANGKLLFACHDCYYYTTKQKPKFT